MLRSTICSGSVQFRMTVDIGSNNRRIRFAVNRGSSRSHCLIRSRHGSRVPGRGGDTRTGVVRTGPARRCAVRPSARRRSFRPRPAATLRRATRTATSSPASNGGHRHEEDAVFNVRIKASCGQGTGAAPARQAGKGGVRLRDQEPEASHELQVDGPALLGNAPRRWRVGPRRRGCGEAARPAPAGGTAVQRRPASDDAGGTACAGSRLTSSFSSLPALK